MSAHCFRVTPVLGVLIVLVASPLTAGDSFPSLVSGGPAGLTSDHRGDRADPVVPAFQITPTSFPEADPRDCLFDAGCGGCGGLRCDACAPPDGCESPWRVQLVPYGWLFELQGDATVRGLTAPVDVSYRDTLRILTHDADFIFSAKLEIENDQYGLIVDGFYLKADLDTRLRRLDFGSSLKMTLVDIAGTCNLLGESGPQAVPYISRLDLLGGVRIWSLDGGLTVTGPLGNTATRSGTRDWVDPFVGGRIVVPVADGADLQIRGDIGGFDWGEASRFTWRFDALFAMQCSECCALRAGYRILDVNNRQSSGAGRFAFDVQFRGPIAELVFQL